MGDFPQAVASNPDEIPANGGFAAENLTALELQTMTVQRKEFDMKSFQHILFPVDFSESSLAVRPFVRSMAEKTGARITLLHVIQAFYNDIDLSHPGMLDMEASLRRDGEKKLTDFFMLPDAPLPAGLETSVQLGEAAGEIVQYAEKHGVDLIMMPTHGYGPFRRLLIGSVTAKVTYDTACAVWTAAHTEELTPDHAICERILCAVDVGEDDVQTMRSSFDLACRLNAKLRFIHAVPPAEPQPEGFDETFRREFIELARQDLMRMQRDAGTNIPICIESGRVAKVIREAALQHDSDLVVMGRGKLHKTLGRMRTNAYAVIRESPCPVLSL